MKCSLPPAALARYLARQANAIYPDRNPVRPELLMKPLLRALNRLNRCLAGLSIPCFFRRGNPFFDHLHAEQYSMFLYLMANECGRTGEKFRPLATKFYLLNKTLHGLEAFYEIELPEIFWFAHPVGTVLGRARYGNRLVVMQGCTVGNVGGVYPVLGERVVLCAHSMVLGACKLGNNVCVGAGSLLVNARVPSNTTVIGRGNSLKLLSNPSELAREYFRDEPAGTS